MVLSGLVFAGAGGVNNLAQSNWIRDKGFGMGIYIPRIVSPITGEEAAAPATGSMMKQDAENLRRFHGWWRVANKEQLVSFWFICIFSITVFSTLAYSTVYGKSLSGSANLAFIRAEGEVLKQIVAPWFGTFFWVFGALSMILVALGTIDYIARIVADVLKTVYLREEPALDREPPLLLRRLADDPRRVVDPAVRLRSAAVPADDCGMPQRDGDVHLLDAAYPAQPSRAAAGDSRSRVASRHALLRDALLRVLFRLAGHRAGAELPECAMTARGGLTARCHVEFR